MRIAGGALKVDRASAGLVPLGLLALVIGAEFLLFLAVAFVVDGATPRRLYVPWLAAVTVASVGYVVASAGTVDPRTALAMGRNRSVATTARVLAATAAAIVLAAIFGKAAASVSATSVAVFAPAAVMGAGVMLLLRCPAGGAAPPRLSPRTLPNVLIATLLATTGTTVGLGLRDVFPLSRYPMYSAPRYDPYTIGRVRFVVGDGESQGRELRRPTSRLVLVEMAESGDDDGLRGLAADLAAQHDVPAVTALFEQARLEPYPHPPVTEFSTVLEVTGHADDS